MKLVRSIVLSSLACAMAVNAAPAAEIALIPVGASGNHSINDNEITLTSGGQRIFLEVRASGWSPDLVRAFQITLDAAGFSSGAGGSLGLALAACGTTGDCIGAFGGTCSLVGDPCSQSSDCQYPQFGEVCQGPACAYPRGVGGFCDPAFISLKRSDYIFATLSDLPAVDLSSNSVRIASTLLSALDAVADGGTETYLGTLVLDASPDAAGTFVIALDPGEGGSSTLLVKQNGEIVTPLTLTPAIITFGCGTDADCVDANLCTADTCNVSGVCVHPPNYDTASECCDPADGSLCAKPSGVPGDFNGDGAGDLADFARIQECFGGPAEGPVCNGVDMDCNCAVDIADVAPFVGAITGP